MSALPLLIPLAAWLGYKWGQKVLIQGFKEDGILVDVPDFIEDQREAAEMGWQ